MASSTAAVTATTTGGTATQTNGCGASLFDIPTRDFACAVPFSVGGEDNTDIMARCCGAADVVSYRGDCGLYCLAVDQSVTELTKCLHDAGAAWGDVFCNGNGTATATAPGEADVPATASASVVATGGADGGNGEAGDGNADDTDAPGAEDSPGAAPGLRPEFGVSTLGLTIGALLFSATAFGAFQV
ncbi:hypothetical protein DL766_007745 [Monosporascus sp. MC13-8B]|uniref:Extracellular membrane protein CFEM domain-containing protein n=1 Tax=Monosporascus cannonballus TaxID=155416 RepID=A0ABY0HBE1_9PEZI|nr:hypothetical protein DL762_003172 [Monosporascus cannonballus]RYO90643.1 hypothetical protein DL763_005261 [Monosporascus cannonballus]RYP22323.1 hypothetical protein DL766_007745 [Monosporascus sp. MC13-8B]